MEEKRRIETEKGDGKPYLQMLEEEFNKMTDEEKSEVDAIGEKLNALFGIEDDEE